MMQFAAGMVWEANGEISQVWADDSLRIEEPVDDARVFGVGLRVDVTGKLSTPLEGGKVATHDLVATATISFRERRILGPGTEVSALRALREYEQARSEIKVSNEQSILTIPERLKLLVVQGSPAGLDFYSLNGSLASPEHQLLQAPGDSLGLVSLLPRTPVKVGESWQPPSWAGQFLAGLEALSKGVVKCTLKGVEKNIARVEYAGTIEGAVAGTVSKVELSGTILYDLTTRSISQADVVQVEKRDVGATSPGLEVTARTRMLRRPAQVPGSCGDVALVSQATEPIEDDRALFRFAPPYQLTLLHPRSWVLYKQAPEVSILRWLDNGHLVAQCNLSPIPAAAKGQHSSAEEFERDVKLALGERLTEVVSREELTSVPGVYVYRVVASGKAATGEMTWIYYLVADPSGRQVSLMFAVETANLPQFGQQDLDLLKTLRFATGQ